MGTPGNDGADGAAGVSAFTITTEDLDVPAAAGNAGDVDVEDASWISIGQTLFIGDGTYFGTFSVTNIVDNTLTLDFLYAVGDSATDTIASGATVSPGGAPGTHVAIVPTITSAQGIAQAVSAAWTTIGAVSIVLPATGSYFYLARISCDWSARTTAAIRTLSFRIYNTTQAAEIVSVDHAIPALTAYTGPDTEYTLPFILDTTGVAADGVSLQVMQDVVDATPFAVKTASLCAIPF